MRYKTATCLSTEQRRRCSLSRKSKSTRKPIKSTYLFQTDNLIAFSRVIYIFIRESGARNA